MKRTRQTKKTQKSEPPSERSLLPWHDSPPEVIEYIHGFIPHREINTFLVLLRVSKHYYRYLRKPLERLFNGYLAFAADKMPNDFPFAISWISARQSLSGIKAKLYEPVCFFLEKHTLLYNDPLALYNLLVLFRLIHLLYIYKPPLYHERSCSGDRMSINTPLSRVYLYDVYSDKCVNIRDDKHESLKSIKNMPKQYGNRELLRKLVKSAPVSSLTRELLSHAIKKPGGNYSHVIAHLCLGETAHYGRAHRDTPLKRLAIESNTKEGYLHYYAQKFEEYRKQWFVSRHDNARETLIDYKICNHQATLMNNALLFLAHPVVLIK